MSGEPRAIQKVAKRPSRTEVINGDFPEENNRPQQENEEFVRRKTAIHWVKTYRTRIFGRYKFIDTVNL